MIIWSEWSFRFLRSFVWSRVVGARTQNHWMKFFCRLNDESSCFWEHFKLKFHMFCYDVFVSTTAFASSSVNDTHTKKNKNWPKIHTLFKTMSKFGMLHYLWMTNPVITNGTTLKTTTKYLAQHEFCRMCRQFRLRMCLFSTQTHTHKQNGWISNSLYWICCLFWCLNS